MKKVKRSTEKVFCEYCGEPLAVGRHAIPLDLAKQDPQACPKCGKNTFPACMLGLGHFVYACEKCEYHWSNIDERQTR